ncbi:hypothetical protein LWF15_20040 [Kineosporia rhizophila]|uniref:hypothetical protein n=1 Tax=Kineosporia TaxID=49184 RepID=UPI001E528669|nr:MULTISPECIES: hypothetical protein [Kineosporia]MCE0537788.1 hypothetical protein [Kineosporia rhizophila]GLY15776.1 hypothetical protein Kisp01_27910 [Kineosporia sp. NBRC 101677]
MENGRPRARSDWIIESVLAVPGVVGVIFFLIQAVIWAGSGDQTHMAPVGVMGALMMAGISAAFVAPLASSLYQHRQSRPQR